MAWIKRLKFNILVSFSYNFFSEMFYMINIWVSIEVFFLWNPIPWYVLKYAMNRNWLIWNFHLICRNLNFFAKRIKRKMVRWNIVETNSFLSSLLYLNEFLRSWNTNHFLRYPHYWLYIDSFSAYICYGPKKQSI